MTFIPLAFIFSLALAPAITVEHKFPTVGKTTTITLTTPADAITITYRPDAPTVEKHETLPTNGANEIQWQPLYAGVVKIQAGAASKDISVQFDGLPISGILMMLIAALILFGGAGRFLYLLMSTPPEESEN